MSLRDSAIVAYAETKVMEKSDRDVWVLAGEILESLLDTSGVAKDEIDGLVMAGLTGTGAANPFWAQTTADVLGLEVGFCEQVHTGGCSAVGAVARAAAAIDAGMCEVAGPIGMLQPVVSPGYGFAAIIVAFVGRLHPLGIVLAALLMSLLYLGGEAAQMQLSLPSAVTGLFQGLLLFYVLAADLFIGYRLKRTDPVVKAPAPIQAAQEPA